jgi:ABC-type branched-subunit amino acid transport system ATPase component/branched-subunit amino acid ABC-type transport system permease component
MNEPLTYLFLGAGLGAVYALCGLGMALIYRASRIVNFAQGAMALVGASVYNNLNQSWPKLPSVLLAVAVCAVLGLVMHLLIQRLGGSSDLARVVVTLGMMTVLEGGVALRYGSALQTVSSVLPTTTWQLAGVDVPWDRTILVAAAGGLTLVLWLVYTRTHFGLRTSAVSENRRAVAALGWNTGAVAGVNWALGSALGGLGGILIAPIVGLEPTTMTLLVIPALVVGAMGSFTSFPLVLAGGLFIGILQSEATGYIQTSWVSDAIPLVLVLIVVLIKKDVLGSRISGARKLPRLGSGRVRPISLIVGAGLGIGSLWLFTSNWDASVTLTMASALIALSLVVLTGYTRQISLGQYAVAGLGAWIATRLAAMYGWPFPLVFLIGVVGAIAIGMVVALPALRARGVVLAVVTLAFAVSVQSLVFDNPSVNGGPITGTVVSPASLFGLSISPISHPQRYAAVTIIAFILVALVVRNVRRSRSGRSLLAVRTNERAAAALGINVTSAKVYAFALASAIAAVGGILLAFRNTQITFDDYEPLNSIVLLLATFVGGIGYIVGSIVGATFVVGSVAYVILQHFFNVNAWVQLVGGILAIGAVIKEPDGVVGQFARLRAALTERLGRARAISPLDGCRVSAQDADHQDVTLEIDSLSVRFGGVAALTDVSLTIQSGEVVGLIGPNGAGKSTLVDAVVGFNRKYKGRVIANGQRIDGMRAFRRSRLGIKRSFQTLELFEELTVLENILAACDRRTVLGYFTDLVRPARPELTAAAQIAIDEFGLRDLLGLRPEELSYGTRRLVAVARALAGGPRILLLDEPAAGLDETQSRHLGHLINRMAREWNIGVLLIEHDVALVMSVCSRVAVLNFGQKIAEGSSAEIREDAAVVEAYIGTSSADSVPVGNDPESVQAELAKERTR